MSSVEWRIIKEILRSRSLSGAVKAGLKADHFRDGEVRDVYEYIEKHWYDLRTRNHVPLEEDIARRWPIYGESEQSPEDVGAIPALVKMLQTLSLGSDIRGLTEYLRELIEVDDPETVLQVLKARVAEVNYSYETSRAFGLREIISGVKDAYEGAKSGALYGIPWPWDCLTADTMGKKKGDFICIYGRMKSAKTWMALASAVEDYITYNQRVMIWSKEMTAEKLQLRIGSILMKVDYQLLKAGKLPPRIEEKSFKVLADLEKIFERSPAEIKKAAVSEHTRDLIVLSGREAPKDVAALSEMVNEYQPDILYVDSFYHLNTERAGARAQPWYRIQCLAEDLKELAMDREIPVVGITQANREGEKGMGKDLTEVAGSDAIAREADLMMRVIKKRQREVHESDYEIKGGTEPKRKQEKPKKNKLSIRRGTRVKASNPIPKKAQEIRDADPPTRVGMEIAVLLPGNREGVLEGFTIHSVPGYCFNVLQSSMDPDSVRKWVTRDDKEAAKVRRKNSKPEDNLPSLKGTFR